MDLNESITDPKKLVEVELKNAGFDLNSICVPKRVYLLADDIFDSMIEKKCGEYQYPVGGRLYVMSQNRNVGFVKSHMCSAAIATQAEDLIASGVKELIHIGYAGGLQTDMSPGDVILTDGAFNDTAVARLYGYDCDFMESSKTLTEEFGQILTRENIVYERGKHWTTDAGYRETWAQIFHYRDKGVKCVEMEAVGLFTIAKYRKCKATAIYIVTDVIGGNEWELGWSENSIREAVNRVLDSIIDVCAYNEKELV